VSELDIPPVAKGVACVDFDGTLFKWGDLYAMTDPLPGAVKFMKELKRRGWRIIIFTSRLSPTWWNAEGFTTEERRAQRRYVEEALERHDIPYHAVTSEKIPASMYIDDKAIEFSASKGGWKAIHERVFG
jgi:hypothetical protein